jgi:hypothetical protein
VAFVCLSVFNIFHAHEHCIKQAGIAFKMYSQDNNGNLPYHTNGFGNALLLLVKGEYLGDTNGHYSIGPITGPGDDGSLLREALKTGAPIPEQKCSRIYIQGLSETNNPSLAILWDKKSSPAGNTTTYPPVRQKAGLFTRPFSTFYNENSIKFSPDAAPQTYALSATHGLIYCVFASSTRHYYSRFTVACMSPVMVTSLSPLRGSSNPAPEPRQGPSITR